MMEETKGIEEIVRELRIARDDAVKDNGYLREEIARRDERIDALEDGVRRATEEIKSLRAEHDYYMTECAEMKALFNSIVSISAQGAEHGASPPQMNGSGLSVHSKSEEVKILRDIESAVQRS